MEKSLKELGIDLVVVNGSHHFMHATTSSNSQVDDKRIDTPRLVSTVSPEEKRNIIGDTFMEVSVNISGVTNYHCNIPLFNWPLNLILLL